jgi:hypothetical protein
MPPEPPPAPPPGPEAQGPSYFPKVVQDMKSPGESPPIRPRKDQERALNRYLDDPTAEVSKELRALTPAELRRLIEALKK